LALRRRQRDVVSPAARELVRLVEEMQACILGVIRQEILSGLRDPAQVEKLRARLRTFSDLEVTTPDHERAAEFFNVCRTRGVQGSNTDFLICAVAERHEMPIFSTDADFSSFAMHLPIELHPLRT
jgi:predicted nucleic acid-binding protein